MEASPGWEGYDKSWKYRIYDALNIRLLWVLKHLFLVWYVFCVYFQKNEKFMNLTDDGLICVDDWLKLKLLHKCI